MKSLTRVIVVSAVVFIAAPAAMRAHFKLVEPASWLIEDDRRDPQKAVTHVGTAPSGGGGGLTVTRRDRLGGLLHDLHPTRKKSEV